MLMPAVRVLLKKETNVSITLLAYIAVYPDIVLLNAHLVCNLPRHFSVLIGIKSAIVYAGGKLVVSFVLHCSGKIIRCPNRPHHGMVL